MLDHFADVGGGGLAGGGGLVEVAVGEAGAERDEDGAGLRGVRAEAHDGDGPVGMIDEEGGELLEVAPRCDVRGDFEDGARGVVELRDPAGDLRGGCGFLDGVRGEDDGFFGEARGVEDGLEGAGGGEFEVDGFDVREEAEVEVAALGEFPRAEAALGGDAQREEDGMTAGPERGFDFFNGDVFGEKGVDADFDGVGGDGFARERAEPGGADDAAEDDGAEVGEFHEDGLAAKERREDKDIRIIGRGDPLFLSGGWHQ